MVAVAAMGFCGAVMMVVLACPFRWYLTTGAMGV
jgi:hypothetical protein